MSASPCCSHWIASASVHLGEIDFEALARYFAKTQNKASAVLALTSATVKRAESLVRLNPTRRSLREQLEQLIADYNDGARTVGDFFEELMAFIKKMEAEEQRTEREALSQEQLTVYDLLLGVEVTLSAKDRQAVKKIAVELPRKIAPKLVIDWRKSQMKRASVRVAIESALKELPDAYDEAAYEKVMEAVYEHIYESYYGRGQSKYTEAEAGRAGGSGPHGDDLGA